MVGSKLLRTLFLNVSFSMINYKFLTHRRCSSLNNIIMYIFVAWFKTAEEDDEEELREEQRRKDEIILSLQGHLNVPKLIPRDAKAPVKRNEDELGISRSTMSLLSANAKPSVSSFLSGSSDDSHKYIIDPVAQRPEATTWTDLIYERIISKRLAAIIEKNRQRAEDLKKKREEEGFFRY